MESSNKIEIIYCKQCNWLMRSSWMAQEILSAFSEEISELSLVPGSGGVFEIKLNQELIWSRKNEGRFPDIKELKRLIRDQVAPDKNLGHTDRL